MKKKIEFNKEMEKKKTNLDFQICDDLIFINSIQRGVLQLNFEINALCCRIHSCCKKTAQFIDETKDLSVQAPAMSKFEF